MIMALLSTPEVQRETIGPGLTIVRYRFREAGPGNTLVFPPTWSKTHVKLLYDPKVWSDEDIVNWGKQAVAQNSRPVPGASYLYEAVAANGLRFIAIIRDNVWETIDPVGVVDDMIPNWSQPVSVVPNHGGETPQIQALKDVFALLFYEFTENQDLVEVLEAMANGEGRSAQGYASVSTPREAWESDLEPEDFPDGTLMISGSWPVVDLPDRGELNVYFTATKFFELFREYVDQNYYSRQSDREGNRETIDQLFSSIAS
jgi:hypothetical protein